MDTLRSIKKYLSKSWRTIIFFVLLVLFSSLSAHGLILGNIEVVYWLVLIFVVILILYNFEAGIFLLLFSIAIGQILRIPLTSFGGSVIASDAAVFLLGIIWLFKKILFKQRITSPILSWSVLLFFLWVLISNLFSLNFFSGSEVLAGSFYFVRWLLYFLIFLIIYNQDLKKNFSKYLNWFLAFALIVAILGFLQLIFVPDFTFMKQFGWDPHQGRLLSTFFDPNLVGGYLDLVFGISLSLLLYSQTRKEKIWYGSISLVLFVAIVLTFSRSAYLALVIIFFAIALARSWRVALLGLVLMVIVFFSVPRSIERIRSAFRYDETSQARVESWIEGWEIIKTHPLIGVGFNNLPYVKGKTSIEGEKIDHTAAGVDSSLLTVLATTGFVGLGLYLFIYFQLIFRSFKTSLRTQSSKLQAVALGLGAGLIGLLAHSQFVNSLFYAPMMIAIWFLAGLVYGQEKIEKSVKIK